MYTCDDLIAAVRRRASLPDRRLSEQDILDFASAELTALVLPVIRSQREGHLARTEDVPFVSGQTRYRVPSRAQGNQFRTLTVIGSTGAESDPLPELSKEDRDLFSNSTGQRGFYVEGDSIVLSPKAYSNARYLRWSYYWRPGRLVPTSEARKVAAVTSSTVVTLANPFPVEPTDETTWDDTLTYDLVRGRSPYSLIAYGQTLAETPVDTTLTFASSQDLEPGDWVCLEDTSPVPQIPEDLRSLLETATTVRILEALGDIEASAVASALLEREVQAARMYIAPRQDGRPPRIINRFSMLRRGRGFRSA